MPTNEKFTVTESHPNEGGAAIVSNGCKCLLVAHNGTDFSLAERGLTEWEVIGDSVASMSDGISRAKALLGCGK